MSHIAGAIRALQPIFVSRNDKNSRSKALAEIRRRALSKGEWSHVVVFPEGTTTNGECVIHFKSGAFQPGLPVQPMLIKYAQVEQGISLPFNYFLVSTFVCVFCRTQ